MEINKQLFEDVLSGKLKGTFVLRNGFTCSDKQLYRNDNGGYGFTNGDSWDIIDFIPETNMKENELTIEIPDGKTVDWDESKKQNKIVLRDKQPTYVKICMELFDKDYYFIDQDGSVEQIFISNRSTVAYKNNASTKHQLECLLAKNQLANVAVYLNNGWKPTGTDDAVHYLTMNFGNRIFVSSCSILGGYYFGKIVFKSKELAKQAIEILGEETIKLALEPLGI